MVMSSDHVIQWVRLATWYFAGLCVVPGFFWGVGRLDAQTLASGADLLGQSSGAEGVDEAADREGEKLLEAVYFHHLAWQSGDFLVRERSSFDSVNRIDGTIDLEGIVENRTAWYRVVFDYRRNLYCALVREESTELDLSKQKENFPSDRVIGSRWGACVDGEETLFSRIFPGKCDRLPKGIWQIPGKDLAESARFPDFRGVVMASIAQPGNAGIQMTEQLVKAKADRWRVIRSRMLKAGEKEFTFAMLPSQHSVDWLRDLWVFDLDRSVPIRRQFFAEYEGGAGPRTKAQEKEITFAWIEMHGVQLLQKYHRYCESDEHRIGFVTHQGSLSREYDFHWFSINQELDATCFDGSWLKDLDSFEARLDPVRAKATSLIESPAIEQGVRPGSDPAQPGLAAPDR